MALLATLGRIARSSPNVYRTMLYTFTINLAMSIWMFSVWSPFLKKCFGSNLTIGIIAGANGCSELTAALISGCAADRWSKQAVLRCSALVILADVSFLSYATYAEHLPFMIVGAALSGAAWGSVFPVVEGLLADSLPSGERTEIYSLKYMLEVSSSIGGYLVALSLFATLGNSWDLSTMKIVVWAGLGTYLLPTPLLFFITEKNAWYSKRYRQAKRERRRKQRRKALRESQQQTLSANQHRQREAHDVDDTRGQVSSAGAVLHSSPGAGTAATSDSAAARHTETDDTGSSLKSSPRLAVGSAGGVIDAELRRQQQQMPSPIQSSHQFRYQSSPTKSQPHLFTPTKQVRGGSSYGARRHSSFGPGFQPGWTPHGSRVRAGPNLSGISSIPDHTEDTYYTTTASTPPPAYTPPRVYLQQQDVTTPKGRHTRGHQRDTEPTQLVASSLPAAFIRAQPGMKPSTLREQQFTTTRRSEAAVPVENKAAHSSPNFQSSSSREEDAEPQISSNIQNESETNDSHVGNNTTNTETSSCCRLPNLVVCACVAMKDVVVCFGSGMTTMFLALYLIEDYDVKPLLLQGSLIVTVFVTVMFTYLWSAISEIRKGTKPHQSPRNESRYEPDGRGIGREDVASRAESVIGTDSLAERRLLADEEEALPNEQTQKEKKSQQSKRSEEEDNRPFLMNRMHVMLIPIGIGTVLMLYLGLATSGTWSFLTIVFPIFIIRWGAMNSYSGLSRAVLMDLAPKSQRAKWNIFESVASAAWAGSAVLGGFISDRYGYQKTFLVTCGVHFCGFLVQAVASGSPDRLADQGVNAKKKQSKSKKEMTATDDDKGRGDHSSSSSDSGDDDDNDLFSLQEGDDDEEDDSFLALTPEERAKTVYMGPSRDSAPVVSKSDLLQDE